MDPWIFTSMLAIVFVLGLGLGGLLMTALMKRRPPVRAAGSVRVSQLRVGDVIVHPNLPGERTIRNISGPSMLGEYKVATEDPKQKKRVLLELRGSETVERVR